MSLLFDETMKPESALHGPSVAVDPVFEIYRTRPWKDWAAELRNRGFTMVNLILVKWFPIEEQRAMVGAFHDAGLAVALRIYPTTDFEAYERHPEWRQISLDGTSSHSWRVYLCPNAKGFAVSMRERVRDLVGAVEYDAIELAEPWFEVWGGPYPENPTCGKYACLCENCRGRFLSEQGFDPAALFPEGGPNEFQKPENAGRYMLWQDFRVNSILDFSGILFLAAREARPEIQTVHMHLADCTVEPDRGREYQAQDLEAALMRLRPDMLIIEDAWQDWTRPELTPDFVEAYGNAYVTRARRIVKDIIIKAHADIGSLPEMRRDTQWMGRFSHHARRSGFDATVFYEYTLGNWGKEGGA